MASFLRDFLCFADSDLPAAPDQNHQPGTNQKKQSHAQQQAFCAERFDYGFGEETGKDPTRNGAPTHHPKHALRLARRQDIVRQGPDLRRCQHSKNLDPDIERRSEPSQTVMVVGKPPEQRTIAGEEQHAADQQIEKRNPPHNQHVDRYNKGHQDRTGNVRIGKLFRREPREE